MEDLDGNPRVYSMKELAENGELDIDTASVVLDRTNEGLTVGWGDDAMKAAQKKLNERDSAG